MPLHALIKVLQQVVHFIFVSLGDIRVKNIEVVVEHVETSLISSGRLSDAILEQVILAV